MDFRWVFDGFEVCSAGLVCSYPAHRLRRGRIALPTVARVVSVARNVDSRRSKSYFCRRTLRRSDLGGPDDFLVDLFSVLKRSVSSLASCIDRGLNRSLFG